MDLKRITIAIGTLSLINISVATADIKVVTSIKPVHSLVSAVMSGVGVPSLIIDGAGSPHTYSLKPSQAKQLQDAKLVFWMGDELEAFLQGPIENIAQGATTIELIEAHGLKKLKFREGGMFDDHGHDDHNDQGHDEHDHEKHAKEEHDDHGHDEHDHEKHAKEEHDDQGHDEHDHEKHAKEEHDDHGHDEHDHEKHATEKHDDHGHGDFDLHVWLDPINAKALVHEIEEALVKADPEHAIKYEANAQKMMGQLDSLVVELRDQLEPIHEKGFIVFHDAYQYFEKRFDLAAVGSIAVSPEVMPGAERVAELREKISDLSATCVFSEPQFEPKLVETLVEGTGAGTGVLDPLGASLTKGPDLYFQLLRKMASSLKKCLSGSS